MATKDSTTTSSFPSNGTESLPGESGRTAAGQPPKMIRILLLEDVAADAELMQRALRKEQLSFVVKRVDTREAFLRALPEFQPDLILSDFSMPQFTALEALRLLHASPYDVPF